MGMSIDKAISHLNTYSSTMGSGQTTQEQHEESKRVAIDTMRKYQKIAELYDYWRSGKCEYTISCMENIGKVLRDGKID